MPKINGGVAQGAFCYDLMYGEETPFMKWANKNSASKISDGLGMLVEQAASSFTLWHGETPKTSEVIKLIRAIVG